jgi:hypothetical protein
MNEVVVWFVEAVVIAFACIGVYLIYHIEKGNLVWKK